MVSTRRNDKNHTYEIGDRVEILRPNGVEIGTLVDKTYGEAQGTHWTVNVAGKSEDISERMLGRTLETDSEESTMSTGFATSQRSMTRGGVTRHNGKTAERIPKKIRVKSKPGEDIVAVEMITGTLYYYKSSAGRTRRVEFLRSK